MGLLCLCADVKHGVLFRDLWLGLRWAEPWRPQQRLPGLWGAFLPAPVLRGVHRFHLGARWRFPDTEIAEPLELCALEGELLRWTPSFCCFFCINVPTNLFLCLHECMLFRCFCHFLLFIFILLFFSVFSFNFSLYLIVLVIFAANHKAGSSSETLYYYYFFLLLFCLPKIMKTRILLFCNDAFVLSCVPL